MWDSIIRNAMLAEGDEQILPITYLFSLTVCQSEKKAFLMH